MKSRRAIIDGPSCAAETGPTVQPLERSSDNGSDDTAADTGAGRDRQDRPPGGPAAAGRGLPIRIGTPSSQPPFDWSDQATWAPALQNIDAVYLTYYLTWPSQGPPPQSARSPSWPWNAESGGWCCCRAGARRARRGEQAVRESGANWTIVRSAFMAQNFNESFFLEPLRAGEVAFPAGEDLAEPFIDAEDIADVAVAALTGDGHVGQLYEVTGPRLLTWAEAVAEIARATGRPIRYVPVSLEDYAALLSSSRSRPRS